MSLPPRLSAAQMFWWSVGVLAASYLLGWVVERLYTVFDVSWPVSFLMWFQSLGHWLGSAGVVGSFVVRALTPQGGPAPEAPRNVDRGQNV